MNRSDLEEEIGRLLNDPNHTKWTTGDLRDRIEFAQTEVQALTGAVKTKESLTPVAETFEVQVNANVIDVTRVTLTESDGTVNILTGRSREDLDFYRPNWKNENSGKPEEFSWDASNRNIILVPKPSSAYAVASGLDVWEVRIPTSLAADSSEPFDANALMKPYHMSIVHWVVAQCFMDDGTPTALAKSKFHVSGNINSPGEYEKELRKINAKFTSPTSIPARIKWAPQGGRLGGGRWPSKSYPLG